MCGEMAEFVDVLSISRYGRCVVGGRVEGWTRHSRTGGEKKAMLDSKMRAEGRAESRAKGRGDVKGRGTRGRSRNQGPEGLPP